MSQSRGWEYLQPILDCHLFVAAFISGNTIHDHMSSLNWEAKLWISLLTDLFFPWAIELHPTKSPHPEQRLWPNSARRHPDPFSNSKGPTVGSVEKPSIQPASAQSPKKSIHQPRSKDTLGAWLGHEIKIGNFVGTLSWPLFCLEFGFGLLLGGFFSPKKGNKQVPGTYLYFVVPMDLKLPKSRFVGVNQRQLTCQYVRDILGEKLRTLGSEHRWKIDRECWCFF